MKVQTALESANNFAALHKVADRIEPRFSFLGGAYLASLKYDGAISIDDLILRVSQLKNRTLLPTGVLRLSHSERVHAIALSKRIDHIYAIRDLQIETSNIFSHILFVIREAIYRSYAYPKDYLGVRVNWQHYYRTLLSTARE
jgi:hypothetical protein